MTGAWPMATADEKVNEQLAGAAALAGQIDRQQLAEKTRVYTLAKQLGISSKVLLEQLGNIGISKKAQSALSTAEVTQLLDSLRSEERRVGKEWRCRWSTWREKR